MSLVLPKLVLADMAARRTRVALTSAAIALSVSLVVAVTSGYASARAAAHRFLSQFLGTVDAQVIREADQRGGIPLALADQIAADPAVRSAVPRLEIEIGLVDATGAPVPGRPAHIIGIRRPDDVHVESQQMVRGAWFDRDDGDVAVIDQVAAEKLKADVGGQIVLPGLDRSARLTVVGIVHKPGILAAHVQSVYVPIRTLQRFAQGDSPAQITRILIDLRGPAADHAGFSERWTQRMHASDPLLQLRLASDTRRELDRHLFGLEIASYLGGTISMLAATFIVCSSLSMGVAERQRTLAMLRAVGMLGRQVGMLVVIEGLALSTIGIAVGVPLGWLWMKTLAAIPPFDEVLTAGVVLSGRGVALGAIGSLIAALLASLLPAWSAMRVDPLEAMSPLARAPAARVPLLCAAAGLGLILIDPLIIYAPWQSWLGMGETVARAVRFYGHFGVGLPTLMVGFFLLAPLFVWTVEGVLGPVVARMLGLGPALLRQQLSTGIWRAAGTCAALMVGLSILVVLQTQGRSAIETWRLPDRFPDVFISAPVLGPLGPEQQARLAQVPGIRRLMPIAIASPRFSSPMFAILGAAMMPDATLFFGVDPDMALDMMDLDFREGSPQEAREMLKRGRHVIVTDEFRQLKGLGVGDTISLRTPLQGDVSYTIAGVVWSPGMDVITSVYDMSRQLDKGTAGSLFGTLADARQDFGASDIYLFAADLEGGMERQALIDSVQKSLGVMGMRVGDLRRIKSEIQRAFGNLLLLVSTVALSAMVVASLGVTNTIIASIRTRRWQFGVLRSIGVTRSQLLRMVLAEALLLGLVACSMGLAAGAEMVFNARGAFRSFIGFVPPLLIPWDMVLLGSGTVMAIALAASIIPAVRVSRAEPLSLLQAGRAAA